MMLRMIGAEALRRRIRDHVAWGDEFAGWIVADRRFELLAPPSLGLVCFALRAGDDASAALLDRVNGAGEVFLSRAMVGGRLALRLAVGGIEPNELAGFQQRSADLMGRLMERGL
jgi:aromatic-L-amino-acid decarboxylase